VFPAACGTGGNARRPAQLVRGLVVIPAAVPTGAELAGSATVTDTPGNNRKFQRFPA
jgi:hypothetical protein